MNNKYTAWIVDDESDGSDYISLLLSNEFPQIKVEFVFKTVHETAIALLKGQPDILFLDIQLKDGDIFKLFETIHPSVISSQLIFVTAYDNFAISAIKSNAADYLVKPVRVIDFVIAVKKCMERLHKQHLELNNNNVNFLNIPTLKGFNRVKLDEVIYLEAEGNYSKIILKNNTEILSSKNLKEYETQLSRYFIRIHHKYLINKSFITEYVRGKGGQIVLDNKYTLDVSTRKKNDLLDFLK